MSAVAANTVRQTILRMLHRGQASHLGSSMSMVELLIAAYDSIDVAKIKAGSPDRSRVIVSKGHAACCTYAVMHHYGLLSAEEIATYHRDGTTLAGHVTHTVPHVEHSTGALGHGLSVAAGIAFGLRSRGYKDASVFCILGDGEIQEGAVWEALMFIRHHNLSNLIPIIDYNKISSITLTDSIIDMRPMVNRFTGFGFAVHDIDGHDVAALKAAIRDIRSGGQAGAIIGNTIKGKGVPFAENDPIWHYRTLNDETYRQAIGHLEAERV